MKIRIYPKSLLETVWQQDKLLFTPEAEQPPRCLRCGQPLDRRLIINALSRYADVHICEACGMDEALRDANRCPLPLTEWAAVKNGLSQQQTNFEDPLLTTSCAFEDLFQQGSRPASEIAYSRSDYDGWKWWTTWHQCQKDTPVLEVAREIDAFQDALKPLLNDFHVQHSEEAAAEAEAEGDGAFRLEGQAGVVELELFQRVAQIGVLAAVLGVDAAVDHRAHLAVAGQRLARGVLRACHGVADLRFMNVLDAGGEVADLTGLELLRRRAICRSGGRTDDAAAQRKCSAEQKLGGGAIHLPRAF